MGGFGAKLARGLLAGLGGYYGEVAKEQQEERRLSGVLLREQALAKFRSGIQQDEMRLGGAITRENTEHQGRVSAATYRTNKAADVQAEATLLPIKAKTTMAVNEADEAIKQRNRESLARLTAGLDMDKDRNKASLDLANDLAKAGKTADRWEVTSDGAMVAFNAQGQVLGKTPKGVFVPPTPRDDDGLPDYTTPRTAPTSAPAPARSAKPAEAWRTMVPVAHELLGPKATSAQIEAKARELSTKFKG